MNSSIHGVDTDIILKVTTTLDDWHYEMRREIQEIIPGVYLGPFSACRQIDHLKSIGITHILSIIDQHEARLLNTHNISSHFNYNQIQVDDSNLQNLIQIFPITSSWIHQAIQQGKVVVCCNGGMSRSPTFVIAYIMEAYQVDAVKAYQFVQGKRLCINPNDGFKSQLKEYEPIYRARQTNGDINRNDRRRRRSLPDDNDIQGAGSKRLIKQENASDSNDRVVNVDYSSMLLQ